VDTALKIIGVHERTDLEIFPSKSFDVKSCSEGKVLAVLDDPVDGRKIVLITNTNFLFTYILDSVQIKKGDRINMGQIIGKLSKDQPKSDSLPLCFEVTKLDGAPQSPNKFLIYR
jgi:hypothetical protein